MSGDTVKEPILLRIMRLSQLQTEFNPASYIQLCMGEVIASAQKVALGYEADTEAIGFDSEAIPTNDLIRSDGSLLLSSTHGNIYVGDTFTAYVNMTNVSSDQLVDVAMELELLFENDESYSLFDNSKDRFKEFVPNQKFDCTVSQRLEESGTYTLVCRILYKTACHVPDSTIRKLFKFPVSLPISISHKQHSLNNRVIIELLLENKSNYSVYLRDVNLIPDDDLDVTRIDPPQFLCSPGIHFLKRLDFLSLIFVIQHCLSTKNKFDDGKGNLYADPVTLQSLDRFGTLRIEWNLCNGSYGFYDKYTVKGNRKAVLRDVDICVIQVPNSVAAEMPFTVRIAILNRREVEIEYSLSVDNEGDNGVQYLGKYSVTSHSRIGSKSQDLLSVEWLGLQPGIWRFCSLSIELLPNEEIYKFNNLCQVMVI